MGDARNIDYAGFWIRAWAAVLDALIFLLAEVSLLYAIHGRGWFSREVDERGVLDWLNIFVLPNLLVPLLWLLCAATPGKLAVSLRIVDAASGGRPSPRQVLLRLLGCYLSALAAGLGFVWIAFDRRKQGWHDKLAGTAVVRQPR